jgi:hypothetical protein
MSSASQLPFLRGGFAIPQAPAAAANVAGGNAVTGGSIIGGMKRGRSMRGGAGLSKTGWLWLIGGILVAAAVSVSIWAIVHYTRKKPAPEEEDPELRTAPVKKQAPAKAMHKTRPSVVPSNQAPKRRPFKVPEQQRTIPVRASAVGGPVRLGAGGISDQVRIPDIPQGPGGVQLVDWSKGIEQPRQESLRKEIAERSAAWPTFQAIQGNGAKLAGGASGFNAVTMRNFKNLHLASGGRIPLQGETSQSGPVHNLKPGDAAHARNVAMLLKDSGDAGMPADMELVDPGLKAALETGRNDMQMAQDITREFLVTIPEHDEPGANRAMLQLLEARKKAQTRGIRIPELSRAQKATLQAWSMRDMSNREAAALAERVINEFHIVMRE